MIGRESRVVHLGWAAQKGLQLRMFWKYMSPIRRIGRVYSWAFGLPLLKKGVKYGMEGLRKASEGVEWSAYAAMEATRGAVKTTLEPLARIAYSRPVAYKRTLVDTGWASLKAAVKTPFRLLTSPGKVIEGVRESIASIPKNAGEMLNSLREFRLWDLMKNTRKAVTDVLLPPVTKPIKSVFEPAYEMAKTAFDAQYQSIETIRDSIRNVMPAGIQQFLGAPAYASTKLAEKRQERLAEKAILDQQKEEEKAGRDAQVKREMGIESSGGKGAGMKNAA